MNNSENGISLEDLQGIQQRMHLLDDHALIRLVAVEKADYRPEAMAVACEELRRRCLTPITADEYYQKFPLERILPDGFCAGCHLQTTDESLGDTSTFNFVGTRLIGFFDRCDVCGSVLQRKWFCFLVPIIPFDKYRVIYHERSPFYSSYIGRKFKNETVK